MFYADLQLAEHTPKYTHDLVVVAQEQSLEARLHGFRFRTADVCNLAAKELPFKDLH